MVKIDIEEKEKDYIQKKVGGKGNFDPTFYIVKKRIESGERVVKHPNNDLSHLKEKDSLLLVYERVGGLINDLKEINKCILRVYD